MARKTRHATNDPNIVHIKSLNKPWQTIKVNDRYPWPQMPSLPRRVRHAQNRHASCLQTAQIAPDPSAVALGERFATLPPELRAHIFSFLLVRSAKWLLPHSPHCPLLLSNKASPDPLCECRTAASECPHCILGSPEWYSPTFRCLWAGEWRSKYAPRRNGVEGKEWCSDCWDHDIRPTLAKEEGRVWMLSPSRRGERCVCARRTGLETLLVCKRWYVEGREVFWGRNVFCFETPGKFLEFVEFLRANSPELLGRVRRISVLLLGDQRWDVPNSTYEDFNTDPPVPLPLLPKTPEMKPRRLRHFLRALRLLSGVRSLELDSTLLAHAPTVNYVLRTGRRRDNIATDTQGLALKPPAVSFLFWDRALALRAHPSQTVRPQALIWPACARLVRLRSGFAGEVARSMKGDRPPWLRGSKAVLRAVETEGMRQERWVRASLTRLAERSDDGNGDMERHGEEIVERPYGGRDAEGNMVAVPKDYGGKIVDWECEDWGLWEGLWVHRPGVRVNNAYVR